MVHLCSSFRITNHFVSGRHMYHGCTTTYSLLHILICITDRYGKAEISDFSFKRLSFLVPYKQKFPEIFYQTQLFRFK